MAHPKVTSVLIIDDYEMSREMLRCIISSHSYKIVGEATTAMSGLELASRLHPDIIFLDVMLPDCSGLEILKKIKGQFPNILVLIVTGNNDRDTVMSAISNGADGFIVKPFNPVTLLTTLSQVVAKNQKVAPVQTDRRDH